MDWPARFLAHRLHEEWAWIRQTVDPHATEAQALAVLRDQCGRYAGGCYYAAEAYCWRDCPFWTEKEHDDVQPDHDDHGRKKSVVCPPHHGGGESRHD